MAVLFVATVLTLFSLGYCGNYTVTEEAWFDIEIKDLDGPVGLDLTEDGAKDGSPDGPSQPAHDTWKHSGEDYRGRFVIGLFGDTAPMTVLNFVSITKGYKKGGEKLSYKNTPVHRVVPDFVVQMGDITIGDGTGGKSIFGERFNDEDFVLSHRSPGWVAMANHGTDTNGSQFYILLNKARWLDGKHVVFGKVVKGMDVVRTLGEVPADPNTAVPRKKVKIVDCGIMNLEKKYDLTEAQLDSEEDLY